jgi:hypothetical protein
MASYQSVSLRSGHIPISRSNLFPNSSTNRLKYNKGDVEQADRVIQGVSGDPDISCEPISFCIANIPFN